MGRVSSLIVLVFCLAASFVATVSAHEDDPWFPGWGWSDSPPPPADSSPPEPLYPSPTGAGHPPSPYYDGPPYYEPPPSSPPYKSPYSSELTHQAPSYPPVNLWKARAPGPEVAWPGPSGDGFNGPTGDVSSGPAGDSKHGPSGSAIPWLASSLVDNPDQWPAHYTPMTTVEEVFGSDAEKVYGDVSLLDGLSSKGEDGYSQLLKEGITAVLNAVDAHFKFTEDEIKKCFSFKTALSSEAAATAQAHRFEDANSVYAAGQY